MSQKADNWLMRDKLYLDFLDAIRFDDLAHVKFLVKNWNNTYDFSLLGFVSSVQMLKFLIEQFPNTVSKHVIGLFQLMCKCREKGTTTTACLNRMRRDLPSV